ncbi:uncharacterized protein BHQ10_001579 [Talaromyces amestolkiae]|uniref:Uncharacterized protein n=1 Tax=Talaromyces amestolkiae TaxID=1196081 RepID=A0A364KPT1_TALAM|nr:uncharacterized protein BHQ10_001579 [Talaromyces amestolkiae]RAO65567.1 hypothetical protein BHQ10_001579 [Talaromyces amestolkiae]
MYFQNVLAFSVALLAGTSIAADYNGGEIPSNLRKNRSKLRAADLLSGSSSAQVVTVTPMAAATPSSSAVADASKVMVPMSSVAKATSSAAPSSSKHATRFQSSVRPSKSVAASSSAAHRPAQGTHAAQMPASSPSTVGDNDVSVPVQELAKQADATANKDANKPFWNRPISDSKPRPNAPDFSEAPETRVDDKDSCSLRCQDLANQCAELLPKDNDFCWENYPACQDRCIKEHVHS